VPKQEGFVMELGVRDGMDEGLCGGHPISR
jgi:hypothetical protein